MEPERLSDETISSLSLPSEEEGALACLMQPARLVYETSGADVGAPTAAKRPLGLLRDLCCAESPLHSILIPKEILEVAEEIVDASDVRGLEHASLELLVRTVMYLDRRGR